MWWMCVACVLYLREEGKEISYPEVKEVGESRRRNKYRISTSHILQGTVGRQSETNAKDVTRERLEGRLELPSSIKVSLLSSLTRQRQSYHDLERTGQRMSTTDIQGISRTSRQATIEDLPL